MMRMTMALAGALGLAAAGPATAQVVTRDAGETVLVRPPAVGGLGPDTRDLPPGPVTQGGEAVPDRSPVPGLPPDVSVGGTPTSGAPGNGGTAGVPTPGR